MKTTRNPNPFGQFKRDDLRLAAIRSWHRCMVLVALCSTARIVATAVLLYLLKAA